MQTQENLFRGSSHCFTSPPSYLWRISLCSKWSSIKELTQSNYNLVYTRPEYTTPPTQPSTQEVAQSQLRLQSSWQSTRSQTLSLATSYRVKYEVLLKKLSDRWNSVRKNRRVLKPTENNFGKKELEDWKLKKLFSFETSLKTCKLVLTSCMKSKPMTHIYRQWLIIIC